MWRQFRAPTVVSALSKEGTHVTGIVPSVEEFEERAAIIGAIGQSPASEAAAHGFGFVGTDRHCSATLSAWQSAIARLPAPSSSDGQKLLNIVRRFLESPFCDIAVRYGWNELELFGCHEQAPLARYDAWGLLPFIAWSKHYPELHSLDHETATLETRTGARLTYSRYQTGASAVVAFWDHPVLVAEGVSFGCAPASVREGTVKPIFSDRDRTDKSGVADRDAELVDFLGWANRVNEDLRERDERVVYALYCEFCEVNDLAPMTKPKFLRHLISLALADVASA